MNSRLEIMCLLSIMLALKQERHETPRAPYILPIRLSEGRGEGSFLDWYAIGVCDPQAGEGRRKPRPIPKRHTESKQGHEGATIGRMANVAIRSGFN